MTLSPDLARDLLALIPPIDPTWSDTAVDHYFALLDRIVALAERAPAGNSLQDTRILDLAAQLPEIDRLAGAVAARLELPALAESIVGQIEHLLDDRLSNADVRITTAPGEVGARRTMTRSAPISDEEVDLWVTMYDGGKKGHEIAAERHVAPSTVWSKLRERGRSGGRVQTPSTQEQPAPVLAAGAPFPGSNGHSHDNHSGATGHD